MPDTHRHVPDLADERTPAERMRAGVDALAAAARRAGLAPDPPDAGPLAVAHRELEAVLADAILNGDLGTPDVARAARDVAGTLELLDRRAGERDALIAQHRAELAELNERLTAALADLCTLEDRVDRLLEHIAAVNPAYFESDVLVHVRTALEALSDARQATP